MKKKLIEVIFSSEKRKSTLMLLQDGPKEIDFILKNLKTTRNALLAQIKMLEEYNLVKHIDDTYELTKIGQLIVHDMSPLLKTINALDSDMDYWGTHNTDFIPPELFERIGELGECEVVDLSLTDSYQLNSSVVKTTFLSDSFFVITSFFHPDYPRVFDEMTKKNIRLCIIVSEDVLKRIQNQHSSHFTKLLNRDLFNLYVYQKDMQFQVLAHNNHCFLLRLLNNSGNIDIKHLLTFNPSALEWAQEIFEYYLKDAISISELQTLQT
ncbi:Predicted transcriptional regulator, contains HTH domain [Methanolobus vulcani]|jgi:predicted transcriptional regulator|uniref:Predicted transcriptional regulator, contains HTH domain n=1 Tax=Methanolobus vulcani TaxID=38026 RepID=A0A7Z7FEE5_9EURY|nr:winged helix-turn-helix domain-containing protein [Methanolobus vulcani]MDK2825038.1 hypothetical protein [Methanolobus sp.]MDK2948768.1 hypothetical protein [Methanolobus sp.]SDF87570.1 Predicted transcriptional regulator, contains HTH domain [Methanolobus vulcani]